MGRFFSLDKQGSIYNPKYFLNKEYFIKCKKLKTFIYTHKNQVAHTQYGGKNSSNHYNGGS